MKKQKVLKVVFLGKKPYHFDEFLFSLDEKIQEGNFFGKRFMEVDRITHEFIPRSKDFSFVSLNKIFEDHEKEKEKRNEIFEKKIEDETIPCESLVNVEEKMIVVHFGRIPHELLTLIHKHQYIEMNFYSISSNRIKGRKADGKSGRKIFSFVGKRCKSFFVQNQRVA